MSDFSGKVALITGAAGNLGKAATHAFQDQGAKLILVDHAGEHLQQAYGDTTDRSEVYLSDSTDLRNPAQVAHVIKEAITSFEKIDVLINIAGGYRGGQRFHQTEVETLDFLFDLNVKTLFNTCQAVIPLMLNQKSGSIINVSARSGLKGSTKMGPYSASKSAVMRLTESMAAELKGNGIRVNSILPGTIDTEQNRKDMSDADFSRWVKPEAIANVMVFLASDSSSAITGAHIPTYGMG